jgi:hypothetical protein
MAALAFRLYPSCQIRAYRLKCIQRYQVRVVSDEGCTVTLYEVVISNMASGMDFMVHRGSHICEEMRP